VERGCKIEDYFKKIEDLVNRFGKKCIAIGECGLGKDI